MPHDTITSVTDSARAIHLLCCMKSALHEAYWSKRLLGDDRPLAHCLAENLECLNPIDPGLLLLAKISGASRFEDGESMRTLRTRISCALQESGRTFAGLIEHSQALLDLQRKPGGWLQLEAMWEHFTGISLSHLQSHVPITDFMNPSEDYSAGCRFSVQSIWIQDIGDDCYHENTLPESLVANDLTDLLTRLEVHAQRCDQAMINYGLSREHLEEVAITIHDHKDQLLMILHLLDVPRDADEAFARFDLANLRIHGNRDMCLDAIESAFGRQVRLVHAGKIFAQELGM